MCFRQGSMCGAIYNVNDFPLLPGLLTELGYSPEQIEQITGPGIQRLPQKKDLRPTDRVLTLAPTKAGPDLFPALWWLALDQHSLKPLYRWKSFNCKASRIFEAKIHRIAPRSYRAVVLARGFFEWQPFYEGGRVFSQLSANEQADPPKPLHKRRILISQPDQVMLLAALCKHWLDDNGQPLVSTGIITLPPHREFLDIHHRSYPLVLAPEELADWLDPAIKTATFQSLLASTEIRFPTTAVAVRESDFSAIDEPIILRA